MNYKKVSIEALTEFRRLLELSRMENLLNYFDDKILQLEKQDINDIKKIIYNDMKRYNVGTDENKKLYALYQDLKNGVISKDKAIKEFCNIGVG